MQINYIYRTTCLCGSLKDHYYIGKHTTDNFNDGYAGSGNIIVEYFEKYGKIEGETYTKEILEYNKTASENAKREEEIIGDLFLTDPLCLNLKQGGEGGAPKGGKKSASMRQKLSESRKGIVYGESTLKKMSQSRTGKKHSEETKKKMSESHKKNLNEKCFENLEKGAQYRFVKGQPAHNKGIPMSEEQKEKCAKSWFKSKEIAQYSLDGVFIKKWNGATEAMNELGICKQSICLCCKGKQEQAGGFIWKYAA